MQRVAIIGSRGAGKSTLARKLGGILGLPVIHLDKEYWQPGWTEPPKAEW
jgi:adenylate kinase family enzyme